MIYVDTGNESAARNFGTEYYFAAERIMDDDVFLFWRTRPTLMIGKYQNMYEEIDLPYARERGIDVVRRLSGGGTIFTDRGSFQYSFIGRGGREIDFSEYMEPVCTALRRLGIRAERDGRNDITADGRKISGNAQYKAAGRTVHHGSLLFSADIDEMERATRLPDYKISSKSIKSVRSRVANISELLPSPMSPEEFAEYMIGELSSGNVLTPSDDERRRIGELSAELFPELSAGRAEGAPPFDFEETMRFGGGTVIIGLTVRRGTVTEASVRGDFFSADGTDTLVKCLCGTEFSREPLREAIERSGFGALGITASELAERFCERL